MQHAAKVHATTACPWLKDEPGMEMTEYTLMERIGARLRIARTRRGLSLEDLTRLGFHASHISKIEHGDFDVRVGTLVRLAEAVGVHPGVLFDDGEAR
jgi:ribosome-binding protein aMBF1 (putative translation factor)